MIGFPFGRAGTILVFGTLYYQSFAKKDAKHGSKDNGGKHGVGAPSDKTPTSDLEALNPLLEDTKEVPK